MILFFIFVCVCLIAVENKKEAVRGGGERKTHSRKIITPHPNNWKKKKKKERKSRRHKRETKKKFGWNCCL
jgi:hypothetical protein